jgi:hypothetical protein
MLFAKIESTLILFFLNFPKLEGRAPSRPMRQLGHDGACPSTARNFGDFSRNGEVLLFFSESPIENAALDEWAAFAVQRSDSRPCAKPSAQRSPPEHRNFPAANRVEISPAAR